MNISFGSILIAKINRNSEHVKKLLSEIFNSEIKYTDHEFIFEVDFSSNSDEYFKTLKEKFSNYVINVRLCWHGFILIQLESKVTLTDDDKQMLRTIVFDYVEKHIQGCADLFEYDQTITPKDEETVFSTKSFLYDEYPTSSNSHLMLSTVKHFSKTVNHTLKIMSSKYHSIIEQSLKKDHARTILLIFMISRSQYLRQFYASKRCTIVDNAQVYDQILSEFSNIIILNRNVFDVLDHNPVFIEYSKTDLVSVISMDIVGFSKSLSQGGSSTMAEQITQFDTLSKWIFEWLRNKNNAIKLPNPGQIFVTTDFWIKCVGDGYIIAFKSLEDSFYLAQYLQNKDKQKEIPIRIGLKHGTVQSVKDSIGREDLIGPAMTLAVRVMSQADAGNIYAETSFVKQLNDNNGKDFINGDPLGTHKVKHDIPVDFFNVFGEGYGNKSHPKFDDEKLQK
jgi:class 3 adenylate cyclase